MLDYNFAGIKAREDSFLIKLKDRVLTSDGKDFYQPNRRVSVYVPELGLEQNMVILQMGCNISAQQGTELVLNVSSETSFTNNSTLRHKIALMN
jgi:prophage tail gpP-like protein